MDDNYDDFEDLLNIENEIRDDKVMESHTQIDIDDEIANEYANTQINKDLFGDDDADISALNDQLESMDSTEFEDKFSSSLSNNVSDMNKNSSLNKQTTNLNDDMNNVINKQKEFESLSKTIFYDIPPENCDVQGLTLPNGKFVFVKVRPSITNNYSNSNSNNKINSDLLIQSQMNKTFDSSFDTIYEQTKLKISTSKSTSQNQINSISSQEPINNSKTFSSTQRRHKISYELWTEKYRPQSFIDLITDEKQNRKCLQWLQQWKQIYEEDEEMMNSLQNSNNQITPSTKQKGIIYKSPFEYNKQETKDTENKIKSNDDKDNEFNYNSVYNKNSYTKRNTYNSILCTICGKMGHSASRCFFKRYELPYSPYSHPLSPILVLHGQPGCCKSTLIEICAKQCHMDIIYMNTLMTSEKHSISDLLTQLDSMMQNGSLYSGKKLSLLLFDDFDSVYTRSERIQILNHLSKLFKQLQSHDKAGNGSQGLRMPIAIICNSLYASNIPLLKDAYFPLYIPPLSMKNIQNRLVHICNNEGISYTLLGLRILIEYTHIDIRQVISTLQTIAKKNTVISENAKFFSILEEKSVMNNINDVLTYIFTIPKIRNRSTIVKDINFKYLFNYSYDIDILALFEQIYSYIPSISLHDPRLTRYSHAMDWLLFGFETQSVIDTTKNYSFQRYFSIIPSSIHLLYQKEGKLKIPRSTFFYDLYTKEQQNLHIIQQFIQCASVASHQLLSISSISEDIISPLLSLITPDFRPIETRLLPPKDKQSLQTIIQIMMTYHLHYGSINEDKNTNSTSIQGPSSNSSSSVTINTNIHSENKDIETNINMIPNIAKLVEYKEINNRFNSTTTIQRMKLQNELVKQEVLLQKTKQQSEFSSLSSSQLTNISTESINGQLISPSKRIPRKTNIKSPSKSPNKSSVKNSLTSPSVKRNLFDEIEKDDKNELQTKKSYSLLQNNNTVKYEKIHGISFKYIQGYTCAVRSIMKFDDFL